MKQTVPSRSAQGVIAALATFAVGLAAGPALAATPSSANASCSPPRLSQPFLSAGDANWYMLAPGQAPDRFTAGGWTLRGGAKLLTVELADGQTGQVLDMPSGSEAVSPTMCVGNAFQTARAMIRDLVGSAGLSLSVAYNRGSKGDPQTTGQLAGSGSAWTLSSPVNLSPASRPGRQRVQLTLTAGGTGSEFQIYDLYIDPRMMR